MTSLRKYDKFRENYPHMKGLGNIFAKFPPAKISTLTVFRRARNDMIWRLLTPQKTTVLADWRQFGFRWQQNGSISILRIQVKVKVNWLFNVTINDISVIYVDDGTKMCSRTEEEVGPTVGLPTP